MFNEKKLVTKQEMDVLAQDAKMNAKKASAVQGYTSLKDHSVAIATEIIENNTDICICADNIIPLQKILTQQIKKGTHNIKIVTAPKSIPTLKHLQRVREIVGKTDVAFSVIRDWPEDDALIDTYRRNHSFIVAGNMHLQCIGDERKSTNRYCFNDPEHADRLRADFADIQEQAQLIYTKKTRRHKALEH
jgi:hypothetical protein